MARAMVTRYGMSEKVGMVFVQDHREEGDDVRAAIDAEVSVRNGPRFPCDLLVTSRCYIGRGIS